MTKQEVEALVKRLERVWGRDGIVQTFEYELRGDHLYFGSHMKKRVVLSLCIPFEHAQVLPPNISLEGQGCCLDCFSTLGNQREKKPEPIEIESSRWHSSTLEPNWVSLPHFEAEWMPFFLRGCWLSGAPIKASAHEKAEWMQGFSQEELEAWNLKI